MYSCKNSLEIYFYQNENSLIIESVALIYKPGHIIGCYQVAVGTNIIYLNSFIYFKLKR